MKKIIIFVFIIAVVASTAYMELVEKRPVVRIVHKDFTEQRLVGQMLGIYLESKGYKTKVTELGGTMLCFTAIDTGEADVYAEYTGTAYSAILKQKKIFPANQTYDFVKKNFEEKYGITWLKPFGWNNTYVLSVRKDTKKDNNLKTISDLVAVAPNLIIGTNPEFINRSDGLIGLQKYYGDLKFKDIISMDQGLTYAALDNGKIDINVSFSTDGRIAKFGFENLKDDKNFFPPYFITPILKLKYAQEHPDIVKDLEELEGRWNESNMQKYNLMVDEGMSIKKVAEIMLEDAWLIKK